MSAGQVQMPKPDVLRRLALSDSGFVFDPLCGVSYTVNASGLALLRLLQGGDAASIGDIVGRLRDVFDVEAAVAEQDVIEFAGVLRSAFK